MRCDTHPYSPIGPNGTCVMCEGARLAAGDIDRYGRRRAPKIQLRRRSPEEHESGLSAREDRVLASVRQLLD